MKKCNYRNCMSDISHMRKDAKFCCVSHKKMEQTYVKRRTKLIKKYKDLELKRVESIKKLKSVLGK